MNPDGSMINPAGQTLKEIKLYYTQDGVSRTGSVRTVDYRGNSDLGDEDRIKSAAKQLLSDLNNGYYTLPFFGVDSDGNEILDAIAIGRLVDEVQHDDLLTSGVYINPDSWNDFYLAVMGAGAVVPEFNPVNVDELIRNGFNQTQVSDARLPIQQGLVFKTSAAGNPEEVYIQAIYDDAGRETGFELFAEITQTVTVGSDFVT